MPSGLQASFPTQASTTVVIRQCPQLLSQGVRWACGDSWVHSAEHELDQTGQAHWRRALQSLLAALGNMQGQKARLMPHRFHCLTAWCPQKEERELEKVRESEQRRATKELMAAQRLEEEQRLKRSLDERMRAKQEEARAREKIRLKLGEPPGSPLPCPLPALHNWYKRAEKDEVAQAPECM